jgi:hypothetical protein
MITVISGKIADKDAEKARGLRAADCFWHLIAAAKTQIEWYALGLAVGPLAG